MKWLKQKRIAAGLTQTQLAEMCGIEQGYYSQVENSKRNPSVKLAKKLANALNIEWTKFFT